jgi:hypothetical protein
MSDNKFNEEKTLTESINANTEGNQNNSHTNRDLVEPYVDFTELNKLLDSEENRAEVEEFIRELRSFSKNQDVLLEEDESAELPGISVSISR